MNDIINFIKMIMQTFILGFTFGIGFIFSFGIVAFYVINELLPKIKDFIINL